MKLIPQYSVRRLLWIMTVAALAFSIVALALRGNPWAIGVAVGLLALVVLAGVYAGVFAVFWAAAEMLAAIQRQAPPGGRSPFADGPSRADRAEVGR